ncbi:hypothetical protein [Mariniflexile sp. AS56]|uniref:hypothetical protein n=1 Tax=Mariniflexile sp. AS56 TaxID=3063957 RepID=UPI0026EF5FDA|nr:hypothetical protein [Mariniflexile sp. AS56]MDO7173840.1 hypothetical protein [Mariniflexile sp. AS56]
MKTYKLLMAYCFFLIGSSQLNAQESPQVFPNDSMTLAQAFINLSLTKDYFDKLSDERLSKILPFETSELETIIDSLFTRKNATLYNFTYSLLYFNEVKLLFRNSPNTIQRSILIEWHDTLKKAIEHYKSTNYDIWEENVFYDLIKFDGNTYSQLGRNIQDLKNEFTPRFNNDVYPDFKKIFYASKRSKKYDFRRLLHYASLYDLSLNLSIIGNRTHSVLKPYSSIDQTYELDMKLDLIARYIQLKYMASDQYTKDLTPFDVEQLYDSYDSFYNDIIDSNAKVREDAFIKEELNPKVCKVLYNELQTKFPFRKIGRGPSGVLSRIESGAVPIEIKQYFFPNPAPLPSTNETFNKFKPELTTLGKLDTYISNLFISAGYKNKLHYYYDLDGYAMTTSLEKYNINGSPIEGDKRWVKNLGGDGKFSYYEIFKSLFFETESEFRMFALVIASKEVTLSHVGLSPGGAQDLIKNSHPSLPNDLKNKTLPDKNLTVLVYHFHQNDIGEVPMLDLSRKLTVKDYLKNAGLSNLIKN